MLKPFLLAAVLAASASSATAQTNDFTQFDVARGETLGEQLVICDRAKFLSNPPSRDALRTYVRVDNSRFDLALPPDFTRPSGWYDHDLEKAYDRLRARGLVDRADVEAARERHEVPQLSRTERPTISERRFLRAQTSLCRNLIQDASRR
jgi:hypothetical protein